MRGAEVMMMCDCGGDDQVAMMIRREFFRVNDTEGMLRWECGCGISASIILIPLLRYSDSRANRFMRTNLWADPFSQGGNLTLSTRYLFWVSPRGKPFILTNTSGQQKNSGVSSFTSDVDVRHYLQQPSTSKNRRSGQSKRPDCKAMCMEVKGSWRTRKCRTTPGEE